MPLTILAAETPVKRSNLFREIGGARRRAG